jgi:H+/Cl- antiporter ClcA
MMLFDTSLRRLTTQFRFKFLLKWGIVAIVVGSLSGSASAVFLLLLKWAKSTRDSNHWLLFLLPLGGFFVALGYSVWGKSVNKGNNLIVEEVQKPSVIISFLMAPLVLIGTIITHVFGGSAGREGTAIQMGGSIADQLIFVAKFSDEERKILLMCGMAAGFSSLFGTPLAGTVFAVEIIFVGKLLYDGLIPVLLSALVAYFVCDFWPVEHTSYTIGPIPELSFVNLIWVILAAIAFGITSRVFSSLLFWLSIQFKKYISSFLLRPVIGGVLVVLLIFLFGFKYAGLGLDTIVSSFYIKQGFDVFAVKIVVTVLTLSAGFKGGEVTPLFFIGATLGSALSFIIPLPIGLLAGIGFVSVFSGATNSPIACTLMGLELFAPGSFGLSLPVYLLTGCFIAYYSSGHTGIYSSQIIARSKYGFSGKIKGKTLRELMK